MKSFFSEMYLDTIDQTHQLNAATGSHSSNVSILHISYLCLTAVSFSVCPRPALGVMPPVLTMMICYISLTTLVHEGSMSFMSSPVMTLLCSVKYL